MKLCLFRVYAIDVMGQPSKSIPDEPARNAADYVAGLTARLDGLHLDRISDGQVCCADLGRLVHHGHRQQARSVLSLRQLRVPRRKTPMSPL